jgi:hypothetical protein
MSRRYLDSYGALHGGTAGPVGFCRQPFTRHDGDVAYCGCCGWVFAIQCCVPGCDHTRGNRKNDPLARGMTWLCDEHWRLVPRRMKAIRTRARRRGATPEALARLWRRLTRAAIERALGI